MRDALRGPGGGGGIAKCELRVANGEAEMLARARADGVGKVIGWGALDSIYMPVLRTFGGAGCSAQSRLIQANAGSLGGCGGEARDAGGPRGWGLPQGDRVGWG